MVPLHASIIFKLFANIIFLALPSRQDRGDTVKDAATQQTSAKFQLLAAPLYRNVTVGQAWVYPSNPFDLSPRSISCECFNADCTSYLFSPIQALLTDKHIQLNAACQKPLLSALSACL
jgi:hypothetical protein